MSVTLEGIEAQIRSYNPSADLRGIEEAYAFALEHHAGQMRKSGEPFISHPLEVAMILAGLNLDTATLQAAILHDVVEDSSVSLKEVRERFGDEVAALVDGVTKLGRIKFSSLAEAREVVRNSVEVATFEPSEDRSGWDGLYARFLKLQ